MAKKANKPGPKPKIGAKEEAQIYAVLTVGASLKDAADYLGVNFSTIRRHRLKSPQFARGVMQAVKAGKIHHLEKIGKAKQWQAAAFMLERRWGKEFGRKDKVRNEMTGANGGPIETRQTRKVEFDYDAFTQHFEQFAGRVGGGPPPPDRN